MKDPKFFDPGLEPIAEKVMAGERLTREEGITLYRSNDLMGIGGLASIVRRRLYGTKTYYVYNQHINYTNVCVNRCLFCAYSKDRGENGSFTLSLDQIRELIQERKNEPITEIHIVGGLNPALPFSYYLDLVKVVKEIRPEATVKAFTAVEIDYFSTMSGLELGKVFSMLKEAGLSMMPGGGAEILSERVHQKLYKKKIGPERWLESSW